MTETSDTAIRRRAWARRRVQPIVAALFVVALACLALSAVWAYTVYRVRVELDVLRTLIDTHIRERVVQDAAWRKEFQQIYDTLYAAPDTTPPVERKPSQVELWQRNRDKAISDRLRALEQWRLREETRR